MKYLKNNKGLTLVEIIISISIFGIMSVAFLNIFLGSYVLTVKSDVRTNITATASGEIDQKISDVTSPGTTGTAQVSYSQGVVNNVPGKTVDASASGSQGQEVDLHYFVPDQSELGVE